MTTVSKAETGEASVTSGLRVLATRSNEVCSLFHPGEKFPRSVFGHNEELSGVAEGRFKTQVIKLFHDISVLSALFHNLGSVGLQDVDGVIVALQISPQLSGCPYQQLPGLEPVKAD